MDEEQANFETSRARALKAVTRSKTMGLVTTYFKWRTGRWVWVPERTAYVGPLWNISGGPSLTGLYQKTYWLCLGWARIEELAEDDPRGHDDAA
jgi:hypothetical protein